ncbi:hypothetical protein CHGG_01813 [Chaetomium globosum CBS 148.51]|uniref:Uncharacterized protein n=1 Tax=Chaetomium globosum (strain ATCC 6205 / CBS 148.51 / DSM 1962 / NBRC 6347 / NRRL 1970) TaxID=306901 RepID=Q2HD91_CHAGB|nr:uncharacterized protein CHGG_01813 [Chaetomium globosum CBS 148.51]EAQ93578.1 hypothetical protein CHGG_01813 [Chaetomium globosum CBS 148.51]
MPTTINTHTVNPQQHRHPPIPTPTNNPSPSPAACNSSICTAVHTRPLISASSDPASGEATNALSSCIALAARSSMLVRLVSGDVSAPGRPSRRARRARQRGGVVVRVVGVGEGVAVGVLGAGGVEIV